MNALFRYRVVLGCGHGTPIGESTYPPTTTAVAKCDACDRWVPVVLETIEHPRCPVCGESFVNRGAHVEACRGPAVPPKEGAA